MVSISAAGIALSVAVMLVAVAVVTGFKREIRDKVTGFSSAVQVVSVEHQASYETSPIDLDDNLLKDIAGIPHVTHVSPFALCPGVIRTGGLIQGTVLKGIGNDYDLSFFEHILVEGELPVFPDSVASQQIMLSRMTCSALKLKVGDEVAMYFIQDPPRMRRFKLTGIYDSGIEEFDKVYALADIRHVQRLNGWNEGQVSGCEIGISSLKHLDETAFSIFDRVSRTGNTGQHLRVETVRERYAHIFDWLALLDMNVLIILTLMILVAGFNMISGVLILILERTGTIGLFKAMGASNRFIRRVFMHQALFIMVRGLVIGNLFALALCLLQKYTGFIRLDQASYFVDHVPVALFWHHWLFINLAAGVCIWLLMQLPAMAVASIEPSRTVKYE